MDILIVRHAESEGNAAGRMQGRRDPPLTELGRSQANALGGWLATLGVSWDVTYASPQARAWETARIVTRLAAAPAPEPEPLLQEIAAGELEGLTREEMIEKFPSFLGRGVTGLGDFAEYGGESYADVQDRVQRFVTRLESEHRESSHKVLVFGHGGYNFQLVKWLVCEPVPRVMSLKFGNCTATLVRMRQRRQHFMGEVVFHVPVDLLGAAVGEGMVGVF